MSLVKVRFRYIIPPILMKFLAVTTHDILTRKNNNFIGYPAKVEHKN